VLHSAALNMQRAIQNREGYLLRLVTLSHFSAMFVAFSIPPFLATILKGSFEDGLSLLGLCYAAPVIAAFAGYPIRTKLTAAIGEKRALLVSYTAVAAIMLLTAMAPNAEMFLFGLVLQGAVAPTFATSSSYLACWIKEEKLVTGISALQIITRVAAVVGPSILGAVIIHLGSPLHVYLLLSSLAVITALLLAFLLPQANGQTSAKIADTENKPVAETFTFSVWRPYIAQVLILFSITVSAPHFIEYLRSDVKAISDAFLGVVFAIPSLAYLCCVPFLKRVRRLKEFNILCLGFLLVIIGFSGQWYFQAWQKVVGSQILIGVGTFLAYTGINVYLVRVAKITGSTKAFFRFELTGRCAMALGAVVGDFSVTIAGIKTPFLVSGTTMTISLLWVFFNFSRP
jgi:MFS family permease